MMAAIKYRGLCTVNARICGVVCETHGCARHLHRHREQCGYNRVARLTKWKTLYQPQETAQFIYFNIRPVAHGFESVIGLEIDASPPLTFTVNFSLEPKSPSRQCIKQVYSPIGLMKFTPSRDYNTVISLTQHLPLLLQVYRAPHLSLLELHLQFLRRVVPVAPTTSAAIQKQPVWSKWERKNWPKDTDDLECLVEAGSYCMTMLDLAEGNLQTLLYRFTRQHNNLRIMYLEPFSRLCSTRII